ncbi:MAG: DUF2784 domain-containing protein [Parafilimonas sp.]
MLWYKFLNYFFFFFHTCLVLFNTLGFIFRKTRKWNLITLTLTAFSWFVLGIWYGWGYCFCTDWHWRVRKHLGYSDKSNSYIHFLFLKLMGINFSPQLVEAVTAIVFFISLIVSLWLNIRDRRKKKQKFTN